jgi:hypothetical protein
MTFDIPVLKAAHKQTTDHREQVLQSGICGCFYCLGNFAPGEIKDWVDDDKCALCPRCGIDSVIGDAGGYPVADPAFLKAMHVYWFERTVYVER